MKKKAFLYTSHQPHKAEDLGDPGFRLQFTNLMHTSIKDVVDRLWLSVYKIFPINVFIGQIVPVNSSFF
jgi:hypothetical protein